MLIVVNIVVVVVLLGVAACLVCPCVHPICFFFFLIKLPYLAKNKSRSKH